MADSSVVDEIRERVARDQAQVRRLARHLAPGSVGRRGAELRARLVRIEFWAYAKNTGLMMRRKHLTIKVWGWFPREAHLIIKAALEADRIARVRHLRRGGRRVRRLIGGDTHSEP
jgi:hypothetical protein